VEDKKVESRQGSYRLAFEDPEFLQSDEMRSIRLALEFSKVDLALKEKGIASTVVVWGSHRIISPEQAEEALSRARDEAALKAAKQQKHLSAWYQEARNFGRIVSECGGACATDGMCQNVIVTGGGPGIMEAVNRGAQDAGAPSIGLNISLPHAQYPNRYVSPQLCFQFRYFALRKLHFLLRARALVAFPGGYGTFDELFETLTLVQTRKVTPMPIVLVGESYWRRAFDVEFLLAEGMIDAEDRELFWYAETAAEIWRGIRRWYRLAGQPVFPGKLTRSAAARSRAG